MPFHPPRWDYLQTNCSVGLVTQFTVCTSLSFSYAGRIGKSCVFIFQENKCEQFLTLTYLWSTFLWLYQDITTPPRTTQANISDCLGFKAVVKTKR